MFHDNVMLSQVRVVLLVAQLVMNHLRLVKVPSYAALLFWGGEGNLKDTFNRRMI